MKKRVPDIVEILAVFVAVTAANYAFSKLGVMTGVPLAAMLLPELAMLAVTFAAVAARRTKASEAYPVSVPKLRLLPASLVTAVGAFFGMMFVTFVMAYVAPGVTNTADSNLYENFLKDNGYLVGIIGVVIVPAFCEELIFRGYFQSRLMKVCPPWAAILVCGLIFGVSHFSLYKLLPITVMGVALSYIVYKTESVGFAVLLHMVNNAISLVQLYSGGGEQAADSAGYSIIYERPMLIWLAFSYLSFALLFGFLGMRMFRTFKLKVWKTVAVCAVCVAVYFGTAAGAVLSVTETKVSAAETLSYPAIRIVEEHFTVDRMRYCSVNVTVYGSYGLDAEIVLTDGDGAEVFSASAADPVSKEIVLDGGSYTLTISVAAREGTVPAEFNYVCARDVATYYAVKKVG